MKGGDARPRPKSPADALQRLQAGNKRFAAGKATNPGQTTVRRAELAEGQAPFAIVVACSDSRVPPEIVFDEGLGDLFVVRVAGNTTSDPLVIGSVEYGVAVLESLLVVVLGHNDCGAVKGAVDVVTKGTTLPGQIGSVVQPIIPAVQAVRSTPPSDLVGAAVEQNVRQGVSTLGSQPLLADAVKAGTLQVVGADYHLSSGQVSFLS